MPAQSDTNFNVGGTAICYTLTYSDGYQEFLWCYTDGAAVDYARGTNDKNGFSDLREVTRKVGNDNVRVWWNK
jgi:hypothetical protein